MKTYLIVLVMWLGLTPIAGQQTDSPPCSFESTSNGFENGLRSASEGIHLVANDLTVRAGDSFTLKEIEVNLITLPFSNIVPTDIDVRYFDDDNGKPGNLLFEMIDVLPTSVVCLNFCDSGAHRVVADIPDFEFMGDPSIPIRYWISVTGSNSAGDDGVFWETKSIEHQGLPPAISENGTDWEIHDPGNGQVWEGVYEFIGDCFLGTEDVLELAFKVAPNPAENVLSISLPSHGNLQIINAHGTLLYDSAHVEGIQEISLQNLRSGLYFVQFITANRRSTRKIIKE